MQDFLLEKGISIGKKYKVRLVSPDWDFEISFFATLIKVEYTDERQSAHDLRVEFDNGVFIDIDDHVRDRLKFHEV